MKKLLGRDLSKFDKLMIGTAFLAITAFFFVATLAMWHVYGMAKSGRVWFDKQSKAVLTPEQLAKVDSIITRFDTLLLHSDQSVVKFNLFQDDLRQQVEPTCAKVRSTFDTAQGEFNRPDGVIRRFAEVGRAASNLIDTQNTETTKTQEAARGLIDTIKSISETELRSCLRELLDTEKAVHLEINNAHIAEIAGEVRKDLQSAGRSLGHLEIVTTKGGEMMTDAATAFHKLVNPPKVKGFWPNLKKYSLQVVSSGAASLVVKIIDQLTK